MFPQFVKTGDLDVGKNESTGESLLAVITLVDKGLTYWFNLLVCLESFYLQDDTFLVQSCSCVLQRLWFPLLTTLFFSFIVHFYGSA